MNNPRINIPILNTIGTGIFLAFVIFVLYQLSIPRDKVEHNGDPMDLRGSNTISLRMPDSIAPSQRVEIHSGGYAIRYNEPFNASSDTSTKISLDINEQRELDTMRSKWCQDETLFKASAGGEAYYDVAVRCENGGIKQAKIPTDTLPNVLVEILKRLPKL